MIFELVFTEKADSQLDFLEHSKDKKVVLKAVQKTLALMETNLKHPSLQTHQYSDLQGANGEKVFESYAQNRTSGAYRVFWHYDPEKKQITIVAIVPHP
jgi:mRNA-degrading endonuclease RelE of RelBE toxin-antitoxin system